MWIWIRFVRKETKTVSVNLKFSYQEIKIVAVNCVSCQYEQDFFRKGGVKFLV